MENVEFVRLPDGRIAAVVDIEKQVGFTNNNNIRIGRTDGAGAQIAPDTYFAVNVWKRAPKVAKASKLVEVKGL